mgnify:FL=1
MSRVTGHSKNGIKAALERNKIPYTKHVKERFISVDGVMMSLKDACAAKGFSREAMYAWRVKRGLNEQEGFEAYIVYQQSKHAIDKPILTIDTCTVIYQKKIYSLKEVCKLLGFHFNSVGTYMKQNKYTQASFNRYLHSMRAVK